MRKAIAITLGVLSTIAVTALLGYDAYKKLREGDLNGLTSAIIGIINLITSGILISKYAR